MPTPEELDPVVLRARAEVVGVPDHLIDGLVAYVAERRPPGGFLRAVLENDLKEAFGRSDLESALGMRYICMWLYNCVPGACYGSPAKVSAWLTQPKGEIE